MRILLQLLLLLLLRRRMEIQDASTNFQHVYDCYLCCSTSQHARPLLVAHCTMHQGRDNQVFVAKYDTYLLCLPLLYEPPVLTTQ